MFSVKVRLRLKQSSYPPVNSFSLKRWDCLKAIFFILLLEVLRSSDLNLLLFPQSRLNRREDGAFSVVGPRLWIDLLLEIRSAPSLFIFKSLLKTHLFDLAF